MTQTAEIDRFLRNEGFDTVEAAARARSVLEEAGLTRPGKRAMAVEKLQAARTALAARLLKVCADGDCRRLAAAGKDARPPVPVAPAACTICRGSNNRRAALVLAAHLRAKGIRRLLIVGGTPTLHAELDQLLASQGVQLRYVDGSVGSHSARDAAPNLQWAQVMVVWGASPLPHKVSQLYTTAPPAHVRVVKLARRGIEAMCREVLRSLA